MAKILALILVRELPLIVVLCTIQMHIYCIIVFQMTCL